MSQAAGLAGDGPVTYDQLLPFDQHHYGGTAAVDAALAAVSSSLAAVDTVRPQPVCTLSHCALVSSSDRCICTRQVLNIGSGLGGPARYLAGHHRLQVTAVEIQPELHRTAEELTTRCGLQSSVHHLLGDILALGPTLPVSVSFVVCACLQADH